MTDWKTKLKDAKEMLDMGLIEQVEYDALKEQALADMGMAGPVFERASFSGPTRLGPNESSEQTAFSGRTRLGHALLKFGSYQLLEVLGQGGMGEVFRARHVNPNIAERQGGEVAIKRLHAQYAQDERFKSRFNAEASLGLKLNHKGIVKVHDLIEDAGELGIVMEIAEGKPLSSLIGFKHRPMPWATVWPLIEQILMAVDHAHKNGVIHRDIKPENIIVSEDGAVKMLDFGIAKDLAQGKTKTGMGMGTVDYMAPEQYTDAKRVDQRADIYAVGMTLYEMLAGRLPWKADASEFDILTIKNNGVVLPPPTDVQSTLPSSVVKIIVKATQRQIGRRFISALTMKTALQKANLEIRQKEATAAEQETNQHTSHQLESPSHPKGSTYTTKPVQYQTNRSNQMEMRAGFENQREDDFRRKTLQMEHSIRRKGRVILMLMFLTIAAVCLIAILVRVF